MSPTSNETTTWLTQGAYDRLQTEREELIANRPAMATEINARREEGDLKENGGYHAAKDEQGKQEARIRQLTDLLRDAKIGETPPDDGVVEPGMVVTITFVADDDTETFLVGSREIAATTDLTVYSPESALGVAIIGRKRGERTSYTAPSGKTIDVRIVEAKPFEG